MIEQISIDHCPEQLREAVQEYMREYPESVLLIIKKEIIKTAIGDITTYKAYLIGGVLGTTLIIISLIFDPAIKPGRILSKHYMAMIDIETFLKYSPVMQERCRKVLKEINGRKGA